MSYRFAQSALSVAISITLVKSARALTILTMVMLLAPRTWATVRFTTLVNFDGTNGLTPASPLVQGTDGNLYGTTFGGNGTFFKISTSGELTTLYNFCSQANCADGRLPDGPLVLGADGNFYGITEVGGTGALGCPSVDCGTVFKVTPNGKLTTIHNWCSEANCADGNYEFQTEPFTLMQASDGNFYGVNDAGGAFGSGTAFKLTPSGTLTTIYNWCSKPKCRDGWIGGGGLTQGTDGNFYGTTYTGGTNGIGTFFKMTPAGKLTTLYSFCSEGGWPLCTDGAWPSGPVIQAANGDFYGTTSYGGTNETSAACREQGILGGFCGTVFKITASGKLSTIYNFCSHPKCRDGASPDFGLVQASDGNFYGVTLAGGDPNCFTSLPLGPGCGTVFKLTESGALTRLHVFESDYPRAFSEPAAALFQATLGIFYGVTFAGGSDDDGIIFSIAAGLPPFVETVPSAGKVGAALNILGTNLTGATSVTFNGTAATFTVVTSTEIATTVPKGARTGVVEVTTPNGTIKSNVVFRVVR